MKNRIKKFSNTLSKRKKISVAAALILFLFFLNWWTQPNFNRFGTIKIWDRNNVLLYESAGAIGSKIPVNYEKIPKYLINAVIASEDISFWTNPGIDFKAILRSIILNLKERKVVSGASTITQQLARVLILSPQKRVNRSLLRKIREILIALRLTATYSKKEIITMYLNEMYFGNLAYGVQAASLTYFDKDVSQLSLAESAFLVGLISSPEIRNPFTNFDQAKKAQTRVLDLMVKYNFISSTKAAEAKKEKLNFTKKKPEIKAPHFVQYVLQKVKEMGIKTKEGINVYTTLDYSIFQLSENIAKIWVERLRNEHDLSNAAIVLIKNDTREIINMLGGINYFDIENAGQVNMATALRQPGSALKPVTYAAAFMQGYTPATLIYDVKKVYKTKKGEGYIPQNYDGRYHGLVLAREALASSFNLPAVEMLNRIGINRFLKVARDLGITTFTQEHRYDLSITLGGGEVTLLELTNLYASFARGGEYKEAYSIEKIVSDSGKILYQHQPSKGKQVLGEKSKQVAYLITDILSDPKARIPGFGEKNPLNLSCPAAVKTGTTTDWHDNWTVGYTPSYTVGVWVGNNDNHPMRDITGVTGAAPIWNQFFEEFLKGKPCEQFTRPEGIKELEICKISGKLPDGLCPQTIREIFISGTEPKEKSNFHKKVLIDKRNGLLATELCPKEFIEEKIFVDYPPEVYSWAKEEKLEIIPQQFSPLCQSEFQTRSEKTFIEIVYPKEKAVFQTAPLLVSNEAIVFEVNVSPDVKKVIWYVDGEFFAETTQFPFNASWKPKIGNHKVVAYALNWGNKKVKSNKVSFTVVEFKGENSH